MNLSLTIFANFACFATFIILPIPRPHLDGIRFNNFQQRLLQHCCYYYIHGRCLPGRLIVLSTVITESIVQAQLFRMETHKNKNMWGVLSEMRLLLLCCTTQWGNRRRRPNRLVLKFLSDRNRHRRRRWQQSTTQIHFLNLLRLHNINPYCGGYVVKLPVGKCFRQVFVRSPYSHKLGLVVSGLTLKPLEYNFGTSFAQAVTAHGGPTWCAHQGKPFDLIVRGLFLLEEFHTPLVVEYFYQTITAWIITYRDVQVPTLQWKSLIQFA